MWFHEVLKNNGRILALSPMAEMTDSPFCLIVRKLGGANVVFREMVRSEALVRGNEKTHRMLRLSELERPLVQQIFGSDPLIVAGAAEIVMELTAPDGIDINMGCPMYKLTNNSNGCALMNDPRRAAAIVREVKRAIGPIPLSVKIRLGWSSPDQFKNFIPVLEQAGADLITVHGRTKVQGYGGTSDWKRIAEAKKTATVPLLANGDIHAPEQVKEVLEITGADGVMIARGALGNPWFFRQAGMDYSSSTGRKMEEEPVIPVPLEERVKIVLEHAALHVEHYGPRAIRTFRRHLAWYFKQSKMGFEMPGISDFRAKLVRVRSIEELRDALYSLAKEAPGLKGSNVGAPLSALAY